MWSSLSEILGPVVSLGLEVNDHKRTNYLHREAISQNLRIHEAESNAAKEFHRVEMRQQNDQHSRGLLQSKVQHEENVDMEKRQAIRENLRDEWEQLTDKAETVLIVNTLMLGVSFGFLIEGLFPEEITVYAPLIPVIYLTLLAFTISSLLLSLRFAMVLRFRVGQTIVKEMRAAMQKSYQLDSKFHNCEPYRQCNRARIIESACDDLSHPERVRRVQSLTRQMNMQKERNSPLFADTNNNFFDDLSWVESGTGYAYGSWIPWRRPFNWLKCGRRKRPDATLDAVLRRIDPQTYPAHDDNPPQPPSVLEKRDPPTSLEKNESGRPNLSPQVLSSWRAPHLSPEKPPSIGSNGNYTTPPTGLLRRPESASSSSTAHASTRASTRPEEVLVHEKMPFIENIAPLCTVGSSQSVDVGPDNPGALRHFISSISVAASDVSVDVQQEEPEKKMECSTMNDNNFEKLKSQRSPTHADEMKNFEKELDSIAHSYRALVHLRELHDQYLNMKLERLRKHWCKPYDVYSQRSFWIATVTLFFSAMTLVAGRWTLPRISVKQGPIPASPLSAASFTLMTAGTMFIMAIMERKLSLDNDAKFSWSDPSSSYPAETNLADMLRDVQFDANVKNVLGEWNIGKDFVVRKDKTARFYTPIIYAYLIIVGCTFMVAQAILSAREFWHIGSMNAVDVIWRTSGASMLRGDTVEDQARLLLVGGYRQIEVDMRTLDFEERILNAPIMDVCHHSGPLQGGGTYYLSFSPNTLHSELIGPKFKHLVPSSLALGCGDDRIWIAFNHYFKRVKAFTQDEVIYDELIYSHNEGLNLTAFEATKEGLYALYEGSWVVRLRDNKRWYIAPVNDKPWGALVASDTGLILISLGHAPEIAQIPY